MAIPGSPGNDSLPGTLGNDVIYGYGGDDTINGSYGDDIILGGGDNDSIDGSWGADILYGDAGNDIILGGYGTYDDYLYGGIGIDILSGDNGDDVLIGGSNGDALHGGSGEDRFRYDSTSDSNFDSGMDIIYDFSYIDDIIDVQVLDADWTTSGSQAFSFAGYSDVATGAGTLSYSYFYDSEYDETYTVITGYTDDDYMPDIAIALLGTYSLTSSDFLL